MAGTAKARSTSELHQKVERAFALYNLVKMLISR
jgi:hypothetical protein